MTSVRDENIRHLNNKRLYYGPLFENIHLEESTSKISDFSKDKSYLFVNIIDIEYLCEAEAKTDYYGGGIESKIPELHMLPFYLYYDIETFEELIQLYDIKKICNIYRVVLIVGDNALTSFFQQKGALFPGVIIENGSTITHQICRLFDAKQADLAAVRNNLINYYKENQRTIIQNILNGKGKILIPRYTYEPLKFKRYYEIIKTSFEMHGFQVFINHEPESILFTNETELLNEEKPDLIFLINKSRNGSFFSGESINLDNFPELIVLNWLQDFYPMAFNLDYVKSLTNRDYIYSFFDREYLSPYGYEDNNVIQGGVMPASCENFCHHDLAEDDIEKYACDICFAGTVMTSETMMSFIISSLDHYLPINEIEVVAEKVIEIIQRIYDPDTTAYIVGKDILYRIRDELQQQFHCTDLIAMRIYRVLITSRYAAFRRLILEQLANTKKYIIRYYGEYDLNIPGILYGGYIYDEVEMSKALQASKVVLQINPDSTMNQRVLESLLSESTVLIYKMNEAWDMSLCRRYLNDDEGIRYFKSKKELLWQIEYLIFHEDERKRISAAGRKKILETMTPEKIMDSMIEQLLDHLKNIK